MYLMTSDLIRICYVTKLPLSPTGKSTLKHYLKHIVIGWEVSFKLFQFQNLHK